MHKSRPLHDDLDVTLGSLAFTSRKSNPSRQKRKKITVQTMAHVGIASVVRDMSVNVHWTLPTD
jgi:hypothetical protein